jgi:branched-chain amino acid transport system permease protein
MQLATQLLFDSLITGAQYALMALSFALIYQTTHFFNFSHAAVYAWAAYLPYALMINHGALPTLSIAFGLIGCGVLGALLCTCLYMPLQQRGATPTILLLASMGALVALQNALSLLFGDALHGMPNDRGEASIRVLGASIAPERIAMLLVSTGCLALVYLLLHNTNIGKSIRAMANSKDLAIVFGIPYRRNIVVLFVAGSMLAGTTAILSAYDTGLRPNMGFNALLITVVVVIIGGVESYAGCIIAGVLIAIIQELVTSLISSKWQDAILFILLLLFLFERPQGLFGIRPSGVRENW